MLADYCLRPVWRVLASYGAIYVGPEAMRAVAAPGYASRSARRLVRYAQGRLLVLPPGVGGPPPAHPERLREDVPLSGQELLLARELWPAYEPRAREGR
ncbi:DUF6059 family protein [Streptomyces justiciae]|uniref:DUF6059 family protein n=1 Tax=Streptomyces justiciae TaxID=2780140 RepID=A0ABU3M8Q0_9ACTN|nr:DUF6059 family protein [Streptomyces justiciae]MDT7847892.1 DUF6059 family protein [Streptomyces justiciae]